LHLGLQQKIQDIHVYNPVPASTYGDRATDYRINANGRFYITNFKTSKEPGLNTVEVWSGGVKTGSFDLRTTK